MPIVHNAASDELLSPYFKQNEAFCKAFDAFIQSKGGETKGKYNAWSYGVIGEISHPKSWILKYRKSTFTSGNLLLSDTQNQFVGLEWIATNLKMRAQSFTIRKKTFFDRILLVLDQKLSTLSISSKYVIRSNRLSPDFLSELQEILKDVFLAEEVYRIRLKDGVLKVEVHTQQHYFEGFNQLSKLS